MRILLDECVPRRLRQHLPDHDISTVHEMGWAGRPDGELLGLIPNQGFDAFITVDRNLQHQQNLANSSFAVVVLVAATNRLGDLIPLVPSLVSTLGTVRPGDVVEIDS